MNRRSFMKKVGIGAGSLATVGVAKATPVPDIGKPDLEIMYRIHDNRTGKTWRIGLHVDDGDDVRNDRYIRHLAESLYRSASSILDKSYPDVSKSRVYRADERLYNPNAENIGRNQ